MPEQRQLWPLLAYGALSVVAFARRAGCGPGGPGGRWPDQGAQPGIYSGARQRVACPGACRGRRAAAPWDIPWRGWKDILWRTYAKIDDNRLLAVAAGVVFYCLLALFPAVAAFVSRYGLFADPHMIDLQALIASQERTH